MLMMFTSSLRVSAQLLAFVAEGRKYFVNGLVTSQNPIVSAWRLDRKRVSYYFIGAQQLQASTFGLIFTSISALQNVYYS
jgi:hypothetical protein